MECGSGAAAATARAVACESGGRRRRTPSCEKSVEWTCKPNFVACCQAEDHSSAARVTAAVEQPTRTLERTRAGPLRPYLVLLRRGFAVPPTLTCGAVRSYRTVSPLPPAPCGAGLAVCFLLHFPSRYRAWPLASLLPVGVRTFLGIVGTPPRSSGPLHARTITGAGAKTSRRRHENNSAKLLIL